MQRTFIAIALALTLSCACASYINTQNYVRAPVAPIADNETLFVNNTYLLLGSVNTGELDIVAANVTTNAANTSANAWTAVYRKLDGKTLTGTANSNTTLNFTGGLSNNFYLNGYAVAVSADNTTGTWQVTVYQKSITGGNTLAPIILSNNTNVNFTPIVLATPVIGKNVYVFYTASNSGDYNSSNGQVNITSFTAGTTTKGTNFNLTTSYNSTLGASTLNVVWGEALGSNQLYANWQEGNALKYATIDVSKGTVTGNSTGAWSTNYKCFAYSTDKKWFGDLCYVTNVVTNTTDVAINYYVRYNSSNLIPINPIVNTTLYANTSTVSQVLPYGPYVAVIYTDSVTTANNKTYSYELWNLDSLSTFKNKTTFLTTDYSTQIFRVVSGGAYTLTDLHTTDAVNGTAVQWYHDIKVGQFLSGSYITSVLGFIMTIVAGVLLF